jgi:alpha-D-ribose 1-methylphosphonate 5-triphosphate synthase subunit PhnL
MVMNLTDRQHLQQSASAATTMWQPCLGLLVVGLSDRLSSLSPYTFNGGNQQGRTESIKGSAIKDYTYLKS